MISLPILQQSPDALCTKGLPVGVQHAQRGQFSRDFPQATSASSTWIPSCEAAGSLDHVGRDGRLTPLTAARSSPFAFPGAPELQDQGLLLELADRAEDGSHHSGRGCLILGVIRGVHRDE